MPTTTHGRTRGRLPEMRRRGRRLAAGLVFWSAAGLAARLCMLRFVTHASRLPGWAVSRLRRLLKSEPLIPESFTPLPAGNDFRRKVFRERS
jgi:hypothetical protein